MATLTLTDGQAVEFDCVLFDNDGTLVDTRELLLLSFRHAMREIMGTTLPDEEFLAGVGTPLADQMRHMAPDEATAQRLLESYRTFNHRVHDEMISLFPGTRELLDTLRAHGVVLGVVTSKMHALCAHGLDILGVGDYFDVLVGPDDWPEHKPHPGPILYACKTLRVDPKRCVYVGDSPFDIQSGNGAGAYTVAALWGMFSREALEECAPTILCESPTSLARFIS